MGSQRADLLGPGHHVLVAGREERQQRRPPRARRRATDAARSAPPRRRSSAGRPRCGRVVRAGGGEQARGGGAALLRDGKRRRRGAGEVQRLQDEPDVGVRRGGRVVVHEEAREGRREALTGLQRRAGRLQRREGVLVLPSSGRQVTTETRGGPTGEPPSRGRRSRRSPTPPPGWCRRARTTGSPRLGEVLAHREAPSRSRRRAAA